MKTLTPTRLLTLFVALLSMVGPFAIDTYLPSFPAIEAEFGVGRAVLAQSLSVYLFAFAVSTLAWGPLADRYGRRPVVAASVAGFTLASLGCALAGSAGEFLTMRALQGLAASGGMIAGRAMIRDVHAPEDAHRALSHVTLVFAVAPAIAPVLGGWLHEVAGWRSVFGLLTGLGVALLALVSQVGETLPAARRQSIHAGPVARQYGQMLRHGRFVATVTTLGCGFAGLFLFIAGAPTVLHDVLGLRGAAFGWQFVPMVAGMMAGSVLSARLAHRWAIRRTVALGLALMGAAVVLDVLAVMLTTPSLPGVVGPLVLYAFGIAVAMPALTVLALDCFPAQRGMAAAAQGFVQMLINALAVGVVLPWLLASLAYFVAGMAAFYVVALLLWWAFGRQAAV